jgi:hypothetical protein
LWRKPPGDVSKVFSLYLPGRAEEHRENPVLRARIRSGGLRTGIPENGVDVPVPTSNSSVRNINGKRVGKKIPKETKLPYFELI